MVTLTPPPAVMLGLVPSIHVDAGRERAMDPRVKPEGDIKRERENRAPGRLMKMKGGQ
jgi:hypothetical protein